jgi:hypothetical protein
VSVLQRARDWAIQHLRKRSVVFMARAACWVALVGLAVMCSSIIRPMPLLIIFAMSVGQVIGIVAVLLYLVAILADVIRGGEHSPDAPGPARKFSASDSTSAPTNSP